MFCLNNINSKQNEEKDKLDINLISAYFTREFIHVPEKTRSIILNSFYLLLEPFQNGILKEHFSGKTNIVPDSTFDGKIIILDFPADVYSFEGITAQRIFMWYWQRTANKRNLNKYPLPLFLWINESSNFISEEEFAFLSTARSSKICTLLITKSLENYYIYFKGNERKVNSLLGMIGTFIFHANHDAVTNEWASKTIGRNLSIEDTPSGHLESDALPEMNLQFQIAPMEFTMLKSGGEQADLETEAIVTVLGKRWSNNKNYLKVNFSVH